MGRDRCRVGFLQTVMLGNRDRYRMLRNEVDADPSVDARWYPLRSWVIDDWLGFLPHGWRVRVRQVLDSFRLFLPARVDAVVVHAPEMWGVYGLFHRLFRRRVVLIENNDAPMRPTGRIGARLLVWADRRADLFVPWSNCVADDVRARSPSESPDIHVLHPGLAIERWPMRAPRETRAGQRWRLLFVGGEALRKGIDTLLDAYEGGGLVDDFELDVATQSRHLPASFRDRITQLPHARLHLDLQPGSAEIQELFRGADLFVFPTHSDWSPWVLIEALATGVPVVATDVGGISDMIIDDETGFLADAVEPAGLAAVIRATRDLPPERLGAVVEAGRRHVERNFNVHVNTAALLALVEQQVDRKRGRSRRPSTLRAGDAR